ncbi:hypothetical protein K3495_g6250 [Podosphaera aphanis]|nr:hypothetical protein K3495_g6250 [Podosphaera aphanis]
MLLTQNGFIKLKDPLSSNQKIYGEDEYVFIGMQGNIIYKLMHRKTFKIILSADCKFTEYLFKGVELKAPFLRLETPHTSQHGFQNPLQSQVKKRKAIEIDNSQHGLQNPLQSQTKKLNAIEIDRCKTSIGIASKSPNGAFKESEASDQPSKDSNYLQELEQGNQSEQKHCKTSSDANLETSTEENETPHAHQQDVSSFGGGCSRPVVTRYGRTVKPKIYFAENTKPAYGPQTLYLAQSLSAVSFEANSSSVPVMDTVSPLFENIDVTDAMKGEDSDLWEQLLKDELQALKNTNTFTICKNNPQTYRRLITSKWVFKYKYNQDGSIARRKSRLVARGYEQVYGSDYLETFASVVRFSTLRTLLAKAAAEDLEIDHVDVDTAFLNPSIKQDVYMKIPKFFSLLDPSIVGHEHNYHFKLNKSLYGLKQAPREWFSQ